MTTRWFLALSAALALPAGAAQAARPPAAPSVVYEVKKGDTFYDLARLYLVRPAAATEIQRLNRVANPRRLPVGRKLTVPVRLLRSEEIVGKLTAFGGAVTVRGPGAGDVRKNMDIREGYELATGANAFLTFELPDGSRTTLPSQSRLRVEGLRRILLTGALQRDLKLEAGRSSSVVTPMTDKDSRFRIQTPLTVSAVRGTQFRVNHDPAAGRSTLEVIEGKVAETRNGAETLVIAGYGLDTAAQDGGPQALLPQPLLSDPGRLQDDQRLDFQLRPQPEAVGYRAQIAPDAGFVDMVAEVSSGTPALSFETLPNGTFFARFTAIDGSGLEGLPATYAFERRLNALRLEAPVTMSAGAKEHYLFKWLSTGGAPESFRFVLSRDGGSGRPVIDEAGLTAHQIVVTRLPPGSYSWRVLVSRLEDGRIYEKWSPVQQFEIGG